MKAEPGYDGDGRTDAAIPDGALLRPGDLDAGVVRTLPTGLWPFLRPPQPGGEDAYPSADARVATRSVAGVHTVHGYATLMVECAARYADVGSRSYLHELRGILDGGVTEPPQRDWFLVQEHLTGPESLLAALRRPITDNGGDLVLHTTYIGVARAGELVVIVADMGWEAGSGSPDSVCQLTPVAVERATAGV